MQDDVGSLLPVSGRPFSVEAALDAYVDEVEEARTPDGHWHPSSLYGCPRKAVYEARGVVATDPPDARKRRLFRVGHLLHQFVQDAVERFVGTLIRRAYRELPVAIPELNIAGTADGLVEFESGYWELQEYKSINSRSFKYNDLPKVEHVGQVTPYLYALQKHGSPARGVPPLGDALTRARITYVSKDDLEISEHIVLMTDAKLADLETRVTSLSRYSGTDLPPRMPDGARGKRHWACGYCSFVSRCWDTDSAEGMN
jgi:hypothetical protein